MSESGPPYSVRRAALEVARAFARCDDVDVADAALHAFVMVLKDRNIVGATRLSTDHMAALITARNRRGQERVYDIVRMMAALDAGADPMLHTSRDLLAAPDAANLCLMPDMRVLLTVMPRERWATLSATLRAVSDEVRTRCAAPPAAEWAELD